MDSFLNPTRTDVHRAAEQAYALGREGAELVTTQAKLAEKQMTGMLELWRDLVVAQQQAALSMGRVFVDALKPAA